MEQKLIMDEETYLHIYENEFKDHSSFLTAYKHAREEIRKYSLNDTMEHLEGHLELARQYYKDSSSSIRKMVYAGIKKAFKKYKFEFIFDGINLVYPSDEYYFI